MTERAHLFSHERAARLLGHCWRERRTLILCSILPHAIRVKQFTLHLRSKNRTTHFLNQKIALKTPVVVSAVPVVVVFMPTVSTGNRQDTKTNSAASSPGLPDMGSSAKTGNSSATNSSWLIQVGNCEAVE